MRIITFNCNGILTMPNYRPWYQLPDWPSRLDHLGADIVCLQETKITRAAALRLRDLCVPNGWLAFWNFHPQRGYSGTVTFVRRAACVPARAEQGVTGALVPDRSDARHAIGGYPDHLAAESDLYDDLDQEGRAVLVDCGLFVLFNLYCPNETDESRRAYKLAYNAAVAARAHNLLDAGREVIIVGDLNIAREPIDHCDHADGRTSKEAFLALHPARAWLDSFLEPRGRFIDATRERHPARRGMYTVWNTVIDARPANYGCRLDYTLVSSGLRKWVRDADIQPDVYGSDHCPVCLDLHDALPASDVADDGVRREAGDAVAGGTLELRTLMNPRGLDAKPPPMASCHWPEFSGRDLRSFFGAPKRRPAGSAKVSAPDVAVRPAGGELEAGTSSGCLQRQGSADTSGTAIVAAPSHPLPPRPRSPPGPSSQSSAAAPASLADAFSALREEDEGPKVEPPANVVSPGVTSLGGASVAGTLSARAGVARQPPPPPCAAKRKEPPPSPDAGKSSGDERRARAAATRRSAASKPTPRGGVAAGQAKLSAFFARQQGVATPTAANGEEGEGEASATTPSAPEADGRPPSALPRGGSGGCNDGKEDEHAEPVFRAGSSNDEEHPHPDGAHPHDDDRDDVDGGEAGDDARSAEQRVESSLAWGSIFAPPPPPLCTGHSEPAKAWTVRKSGPNNGRKFWMCARPVGPGYDDGSRPRSDVDARYRCGFWKWDSDLRKASATAPATVGRQQQQQRLNPPQLSRTSRSATRAAAAAGGTADSGADARSFHEVAGRAPLLGSGDKRLASAGRGERNPPHKRIR